MSDLPVIVHNEAPAAWNDWVARGAGGPYQTWQFGQYWRAMLGYRPKYLVAGDPTAPDGIMLAFSYTPLHRRLNGVPLGTTISGLTTPIFGCLGSIDGPVVLDTSHGSDVCVALLQHAARLAAPIGGLWSRGLCHYGSLDLASDPTQLASRLDGSLTVQHTLLVQLAGDADAAWTDLPREARKAVRKAQKQGITVTCLDGADAEQARRFWTLCDQAKGGKSYGDQLPVTSSQFLATEGFQVPYFIASQDGEPISGLGLHAYGGYARELAAWNTPRCLAEGLGGGDAIKWEVIKWCTAHGIGTYDLAGIRLQPDNPKEVGIARFKKKWTRTIVPVVSLRTQRAFVSA